MVNRWLWSVMTVVSAAYVGMAAWALNEGLADAASLMWVLFVVPSVAVAGAVPLWKRPRNRIGQLLLGAVLTMFMIPSLLEIPTVIAHADSGTQPWMWAPMWINMTLTMVAMVLLSRLIVLLPEGQIRNRRERRFLGPIWIVVLGPTASLMSNQTVLKYEQTFPGVDGVASPYTIEALLPYGAAIHQGGQILAGLVFMGAMLLQILRYRRSPVSEKKQVRWVIFATGLAVVIGSIPVALAYLGVIDPLGHSLAASLWSAIPIILVPASIAVAILEPKWVDVDIVIRKSFVYGALSFLILILYIGIAAAFGVAAGARMEIEIAVILTVLVALLFQPARMRLQTVADRWVFGVRPTKYEAVAEFTENIEQASDPTELMPQLVETIQKALRLQWTSATLDDGFHAGVGTRTGDPILTAPIGVGEETIGDIECGAKTEGSIGDDEIQLVHTLAGQVGLAVMNARLAGRIVNAAENERRRIERNIHDGAQQELVALVARLGMARSSASRGELTTEEIDDLQREARQILSDLRELAQGIHPSVLTDGGILEAVEERCARLPLDVSLDAPETLRSQRFHDDIEGAAYFFITESLTNVLKHADATHASVRLQPEDSLLMLNVSDDGQGFDPALSRQNGLAGLRDRINALGGTVTVSSRPGQGTQVSAWLPTE